MNEKSKIEMAFEPLCDAWTKPENRIRKLFIPKEFLLETVIKCKIVGNYISIPCLDLPDDVRVLSVDYDPCWGQLVLIIASDTFSALSEGCEIPVHGIKYRGMRIRGRD